jgi:flagellar M-ring protein FliF
LPAPTRKNELLPVSPEQMQLEDARRLAKENPMAVANILKTWVNGDPV